MFKKKKAVIIIGVICLCLLCSFQYFKYKAKNSENNQVYKNSILRASENFGHNFEGDKSKSQKEYSYREAMSYTKASSELIITTSLMNENERIQAKEVLNKFHKFLLTDLYDETVQGMYIKVSQCFKNIYERPDKIDSYYQLEEIMKDIEEAYSKHQ
jgi:type II secretory pathway pseudopilin PulG